MTASALLSLLDPTGPKFGAEKFVIRGREKPYV